MKICLLIDYFNIMQIFVDNSNIKNKITNNNFKANFSWILGTSPISSRLKYPQQNLGL